ncbi:unnamed protein product, partial [marine sediment metagenome]
MAQGLNVGKYIIDLMADLEYDIMAIVDVVGGGFNKELVGITKYDKNRKIIQMEVTSDSAF